VVVDDQTIFRELVADLLASSGHEVVAQPHDVETAARQIPTLHADLLVLDVMLPDGSGLDLLHRLGAPLRRTPVLLLTASERAEVVQEALRLGVDGIVMKGVPLSELRSAIESVMRGQPYFCSASQRLLRPRLQGASDRLTPRERQIALMIARGLSSKDIAQRLDVSVKTVINHRVKLMAKLDAHNIADVTRYAIENGLIAKDA
jgi:DNA-binding NarL/FixJ family response regulator